MSNVKTQSSSGKKYDLEERTAKFGEAVITYIRMIEKNEVTRPLVSQLVRSATSVGANYMEADGAESKKDFQHKIAICKKEAKETKHWLRMLALATSDQDTMRQALWREAQELSLILSAILRSAKGNVSLSH